MEGICLLLHTALNFCNNSVKVEKGFFLFSYQTVGALHNLLLWLVVRIPLVSSLYARCVRGFHTVTLTFLIYDYDYPATHFYSKVCSRSTKMLSVSLYCVLCIACSVWKSECDFNHNMGSWFQRDYSL